MTVERKDLTEFLVLNNPIEGEFWDSIPVLWHHLFPFDSSRRRADMFHSFMEPIFLKLQRKIRIPSRVNYDDSGIYVTRKEERFYPWSDLQVGIKESTKFPDLDVVSTVIRLVDDELFMVQRSPKQYDETSMAAMVRLKEFLKVLAEFTPAQSVSRTNKSESASFTPFIAISIVAALLFYFLPGGNSHLRHGIISVVCGILLWLYPVILMTKSILSQNSIYLVFAKCLIAVGIFNLIRAALIHGHYL